VSGKVFSIKDKNKSGRETQRLERTKRTEREERERRENRRTIVVLNHDDDDVSTTTF